MVGEKIAEIGIPGSGFAFPGRIGEHGPHLVRNILHAVRKEDAVIVAFGHLAAVQARAFGRRGQYGLRLGKRNRRKNC